MFSPLEQFDVKPLIFITLGNEEYTFFDIFIPLLLIIILFIYIYLLKKYFKLVPYSIQYFLEDLLDFIFSIIKNQVGSKEAYVYLPLISTLFIFVLLSNLLSIIPFGISLTSHLIILLWLSITIGSGIFFLGMILKHMDFLKIFIPKCPIVLLPVLIIIELFSFIIRCFSLAIRLAANMLAGHTLLAIIALFIVSVIFINILFSSIGFISMLAVLLLEIGVSCLQAYVITILTCIYLNDIYNNQH